MFARRVSIRLKPHTLADFTKTLQEIVPSLRKQPGFKDEIAFAIPGTATVLAVSVWETRENAEAYDAGAYQDVVKLLANVMEGPPKVNVTEVIYSTFHEEQAAVSAA